MVDFHNLDAGTPALTGMSLSLHILNALNAKGILSDSEVTALLQGSLNKLADANQRQIATDMIKDTMPNCGL